MAERYRLRLEEAQERDWRVLLSLSDDAFEMVGTLLAAAVTISEDDPVAREQLRRLLIATVERLDQKRGGDG